jgi:hypothetical protein
MKELTLLALAVTILGAAPAAAQVVKGSSPQAPEATAVASSRSLTASERQQLQSMIAQHDRVRARLSPADRADLDKLTAHVRQELFAAPPRGKLLDAATQIVGRTIAGLGAAEATTIAEYALGGLATVQPTGPRGVAGASASGGSPAGVESGAGGGQAQFMSATQQMQETQMSFNLQYLQLQQSMQNESRQFTLVSNIMKTKHDTVKNSISNIR